MAKISIVSPIFREEQTLHELYRRLHAVLSPITEDFEIVLVSDGGRDRSWDIICELSAADPRAARIEICRPTRLHAAQAVAACVANHSGLF